MIIWLDFMTLILIAQAITIIHNPEDFKVASYSYLANVYALLIFALISMLKVELTQNDAVFVLIATVSPATTSGAWRLSLCLKVYRSAFLVG
jgi:hypothetical protein